MTLFVYRHATPRLSHQSINRDVHLTGTDCMPQEIVVENTTDFNLINRYMIPHCHQKFPRITMIIHLLTQQFLVLIDFISNNKEIYISPEYLVNNKILSSIAVISIPSLLHINAELIFLITPHICITHEV